MVLNRNQRRELDRREQRLMKWFKTLSKEKVNFIHELMIENSKQDIYCFGYAWEMVLRPIIYSQYDNKLIAEHELTKIEDLVEAEGQKVFEFRKNGGDYIMEIKNSKQGIIKAYEKMKGMGMKDKNIYEELYLKYPKFSNNAIKNVVLEYKKDLKTKEDDKEIQKAAEYILGEDNNKTSVENNKTVDKNNEKVAVINKDFEEAVQDMVNEVHLEEISKKIIADVKGSLGEYHIEDNKVTIKDFTFSSQKDIDEEIALRKKVIEKQLKELDVMNKEYRAVLKKYIA